MSWSGMRNATALESILPIADEKAKDALANIVAAYDAYRQRGVNPAPGQYANLVKAIEDSRAEGRRPMSELGKYEREAMERRVEELQSKRRYYGLSRWDAKELDSLESELNRDSFARNLQREITHD